MRLTGLALLLLFALTLFVSATLLFLVQPMVGKMLLPLLGGTPAVWNTCMVFFQALLLAGYGYAHITTSLLGPRRQALLHLFVLVLPLLTLSLRVNPAWLDYAEGNPFVGLLLVLLFSAGLPFLVVSTSAPLLQKWFAETGHPAAKDPYFLYGASNLGSMLALFGYPLLVEPELTLANQRLLWGIGYGVLAALIAFCAATLWRSPAPSEAEAPNAEDLAKEAMLAPVTTARRLRWIALAFVPSSLMLGVTTYVTTDIAAIPLLWVVPLGLYLLSFILVFSRLPGGVHRGLVGLLPFLVLPLLFLLLSEMQLRIWWKILLHLAVLFTVAMICHGELARDRPPTRYLTEFYLWMSFGGVLGGLFNALLAPVAFQGIIEYPIALVAACLLLPSFNKDEAARSYPLWDMGLMGFLLGAGVALLMPALGRRDLDLAGLGRDGLIIGVSIVVAIALALVLRRVGPEERVTYWLDFGLPAALFVLDLGLNLGLRIFTVHRGLDRMFSNLLDVNASWMPRQMAHFLHPDSAGPLKFFLFIVPVVLCYFFINRRIRFGLAIGALLLANGMSDVIGSDVLLRERSFFGAMAVADDGTYHRLEHGTTLHGQQRVHWDQAEQSSIIVGPLAAAEPLSALVLCTAALHPDSEPLTYFHRTGPIGQVFAAYAEQLAGKNVGLVGLGSGTLASYGQRGQKLTYFEIDPLVKRIAYNPKYFTFVQDALARGVHIDLVMGDARLRLEERARDSSAEKFQLLVIDAFSSDSIPVHLITREAIQIYLSNLAEDGVIAFHISNRYLNLEPVLARLAADAGLVAFQETDYISHIPGKASSHWVVLARHRRDLDRLLHAERWETWREERGWNELQRTLEIVTDLPDVGGLVHVQATIYLTLMQRQQPPWQKLKEREDVGVWTDDYSNLLRVFDWK